MCKSRIEPNEHCLLVGSIALSVIVICSVLVTMVFALSLAWTIGLSAGLLVIGCVTVAFTIGGWQDWRLFRDTAVESPGEVVLRIHEQNKGDYGGIEHEYFLVVRFMNGDAPISIKERVDETTYAKTQKGTSLVVRFAPSNPRLARLRW